MYLNASATNADTFFGVRDFIAKNKEADIRPDVFYSKQLLDTIRYDADKYLYYRYAESAPIEEKAGELVLRRWTPLQAHTKPLAEGVPPKSDKGTVQKYTMKAEQYGRYMEFSDRVDFQMIDPVIAMYAKEYSIVAIETLDLLARETLMTNCTQYFAGTGDVIGGSVMPAWSFDSITAGTDLANMLDIAKPRLDDLRKAVMIMKRNWVKPRQNGNFHVICSPEFTFDMVDDPRVEKYMTINQTTKTMYDGSVLVPMFGLEFYECDLVPKGSRFVDGTTPKYIKLDTSGSDPVIGPEDVANSPYTGYLYDGNAPAGAYDATNTRLLNTGMETSYVEDFVVGEEAEVMFHHIFILGDKALYRTGLKGEDSAKMYTKPLGSSGVLDPIDQRQSIGFKINSVGFAVIDPKAVVDYICLPSLAVS